MSSFTAFVAVNSGYDAGANGITEHAQAQEIIAKHLSKYPVDNMLVHPARVVWSQKRGCQKGGSPCSFVVLDQESKDNATNIFGALKKDLQLVTLGVTGQENDFPNKSMNYTAGISLPMQEAAERWQTEMEHLFAITNIEISAGFWQDGDQTCFDCTINPERYLQDRWHIFDHGLSDIFTVCFPDNKFAKTPCSYLYLSDKSATL